MEILLLFVLVIGLMLAGVPIAVALGFSSISFLLLFSDSSLASVAQTLFEAFEGHATLLAIPFFVISGYLMGRGGIAKRLIEAAKALVGWDKVQFDSARVTLGAGQALTFNGIAQGYIADRVADLLRGEGLTDILIDTGEFRALGQHPHGGPWPVRLASGGRVPLVSRAVATSAVHGTTFDDGAQIGHILDPQSGLPARGFCKELSISARSAAVADALSSAGCLCGNAHELDVLLSKFDGAKLEAVVAA